MRVLAYGIGRTGGHRVAEILTVRVCRPDLKLLVGILAERHVVDNELLERLRVCRLTFGRTQVASGSDSKLESRQPLLAIDKLPGVEPPSGSLELIQHDGPQEARASLL